MAAPRFHVDLPLAPHTVVALPEATAHHALRVLRLRAGTTVVLFDGRGGEYPGRLEVEGRKASVVLEAAVPREAESPLAITLVQAVPSGDKMDWVVEKAVELGACAVQPVQSERSVLRLSAERAEKRRLHWQAIAIAASEQCGRNRVMPVLPLLAWDAWIAGQGADRGWKFVLHPMDGQPLSTVPRPDRALTLLVGPEGGLTEDEVAAARRAGYAPLRCGPRILRTETAGLAALAALQARHGDF